MNLHWGRLQRGDKQLVSENRNNKTNNKQIVFHLCVQSLPLVLCLSLKLFCHSMATAYLELNRVEHDRICRSGLQVTLEHTRKTTLELQALKITELKRKISQLEEDNAHLIEHCFDLCGRVDGLQEDLRFARTGIQEVLGSALKVLRMVEGIKTVLKKSRKSFRGSQVWKWRS